MPAPETPAQDALLPPFGPGGGTCQKAGRARREHEVPQTIICCEQDFEKPFRSWGPWLHPLRHARHAQRCLAGVMIHLCGSRSTRRPIVSFHFVPTGVRVLHLGGGAEGRGRGSPSAVSITI